MSWVPITPGGSILMDLESDTEEEAWKKLMEAAAHMPYQGKKGFQERGYEVAEVQEADEPTDNFDWFNDGVQE